MSASLPTAIVLFRGNSPNSLAFAVEMMPTNLLIEILPFKTPCEKEEVIRFVLPSCSTKAIVISYRPISKKDPP